MIPSITPIQKYNGFAVDADKGLIHTTLLDEKGIPRIVESFTFSPKQKDIKNVSTAKIEKEITVVITYRNDLKDNIQFAEKVS